MRKAHLEGLTAQMKASAGATTFSATAPSSRAEATSKFMSLMLFQKAGLVSLNQDLRKVKVGRDPKFPEVVIRAP